MVLAQGLGHALGVIEQQDCSMLDWTSAANGALLVMPEAPQRRLRDRTPRVADLSGVEVVRR